MTDTIDKIRDLPLFSGLSSVELEELAGYFTHAAFAVQSDIMREGDTPDHPIYILCSGSVEILKLGTDGKNHLISALSAPSVFGEIEVLAGRKAIASVRAVSDISVVCIGRGVFDELCRSNRSCVLKLVRNIATTLAHRLAATDAKMATYFERPEMRQHAQEIGNMVHGDWPAS